MLMLARLKPIKKSDEGKKQLKKEWKIKILFQNKELTDYE